jgi:hypothetical protein
MTNMKQIALMLGLEWDEDKGESQIFYVNGYTFPYKLSGNKLQCKKYGCWQESTIIFNKLFNVSYLMSESNYHSGSRSLGKCII